MKYLIARNLKLHSPKQAFNKASNTLRLLILHHRYFLEISIPDEICAAEWYKLLMHAAITCSEPTARQGGRNRSTAQAPQTTTQDRRAQKLNIELNKRISSIDSMQELCELIHARSTQFDHVNVATAFRKVLQMSRRGGSEDTVAKALRTLEDSAL